MTQKKTINIIYICFLLLLPFIGVSCDKLPENDLDGMWQLLTIEKDGESSDVKNKKIYWNFRRNILQLNRRSDTERLKLYSHNSMGDSKLHIYDFCSDAAYEKESDDNQWLTSEEDIKKLNVFGIYPEEDISSKSKYGVTFDIAKLNSSTLILSTKKERLTFRKF